MKDFSKLSIKDKKFLELMLSFYFHELKEAELMEQGYDWYTAHPMAIAHYGVSPYSLYHPEVIRAYPEEFNRNWMKAWRIE
ncbi:hypothetical protein [Nostoc sp.]|uniref:hypothetical protein n=1 Tax=Nostoc sp. TaxID=1180 RepID=UPI002FF921D7